MYNGKQVRKLLLDLQKILSAVLKIVYATLQLDVNF